MTVTVEAIGAAVRQKITEGLPPTDAAQRVAEEFVGEENGKLRALLDSGILTLAFREIEYSTIMFQRPNPRGNDTLPYRDGPNDSAGTANPNGSDTPISAERRTRYSFDGNKLDLVLPVTGTNRRKRLGDWVKEDALAVYNSYRARAANAKQSANTWKRIAGKIGDGTLDGCWWKLEDVDRRAIVGKSA